MKKSTKKRGGRVISVIYVVVLDEGDDHRTPIDHFCGILREAREQRARRSGWEEPSSDEHERRSCFLNLLAL